MPIQEPEYDLIKHPGDPCPHLCETGCGVFGTPARPPTCHTYACNWLRGDGTIEQRPDRMQAMPTIAEDKMSLALYLAPGLTPDTMTREAQRYARRWHKLTGNCVLYVWGVGYSKCTAHWADGRRRTEDTEYSFKREDLDHG